MAQSNILDFYFKGCFSILPNVSTITSTCNYILWSHLYTLLFLKLTIQSYILFPAVLQLVNF